MSLPIKIKLPEHFLDPEVRCGYEVSSKLKKVWAVELDLLAEFDRVCSRHDINYQVFAGTLLGAVRHKGFIPWDDDVDVAMSRADYEKLLSIANEFRHPYFLQTPHNDTMFFSTHCRLRNCLTTGAIQNNLDVGYNNGIYIDVFVLDCYTNSRIGYILQSCFIRLLTVILVSKQTVWFCHDSLIKRLIRKTLRFLFRSVSYKTLLCKRDKIVSMFNGSCCSGRRVGLITHVNCFTEKYWLMESELQNMNRYQFECLTVPGPSAYDSVLRRPYGDYMKYPPAKERGKWHEGTIIFEPEIPYEEFLKDRTYK